MKFTLILFFLVFLGSRESLASEKKNVKTSQVAPVAVTENWSSELALKDLQDGNSRFVVGKLKNPHHDLETLKKLASGQKPKAIILSCSDSRLPPEIVFDQGLGDIFSVRVAGNIINADILGSIEYAAEHLGSKLLIVMGHTKCGAVKAACEKAHGSSNLEELVGKIKPKTAGEACVADTVPHNVRSQILSLKWQSPVLAKMINADQIKVVGAVYDLDTGRVDFLP